MTAHATANERQVTFDETQNHELDNNDNFSPDDKFLCFDTREGDNLALSRLIAKVEIATGVITHLYEPKNPNDFGPGILAASYSHANDEVSFIHGPLHPTGEANQYEKHRRLGGIVAGDGSGTFRFADVRDTKPPFTVGALRGGTHRHEFLGNGKWLGFTYNDAVMRSHGIKIGKELDLRTIGVTKLGHPVTVDEAGQFSQTSDGFSVLVVVVTADPQPGSDEISHAASDSWVGKQGYKKANGSWQLARSFIGTVRDKNGQPVNELFVVDIPDDITKPGPLGPLEGTETSFPMPPAGAVQRRLSFSADSPFPGCEGNARSADDGSQISFRMRDSHGDWQIFVMPPTGGEPQQATSIAGGVTTDARWHPSGNYLACVAGEKLLLVTTTPGDAFGETKILSERSAVKGAGAPFALVWSHDGKTLAYNRKVPTANGERTQIFVLGF